MIATLRKFISIFPEKFDPPCSRFGVMLQCSMATAAELGRFRHVAITARS
jgi:hypothetical protein